MAWSEVVAGGIGVVGGIAGTVVGVLLDRHLRKRGHVNVAVEDFRLFFFDGAGNFGKAQPFATAQSVLYTMKIEAFNHRDDGTGFRAIQVQFEDAQGHVVAKSIPLRERDPLKLSQELPTQLEVINLPPHQWMEFKVDDVLWLRELPNLGKTRDIYLCRTSPEGVRSKQRIAHLDKDLQEAGRSVQSLLFPPS